jgi:hypothetical protein
MRRVGYIASGLATLALFSCGGGGGSSSNTTSSIQYELQTPSSQDINTYRLVGYAIDDYLLNATVKVYDIETGKLLAQTKTGNFGEFKLASPWKVRFL